MTVKAERFGLAILLSAFVILGGIYALTTPLFEASDEVWHYPFVQHLATGHGLPVQDPAQPTLWKQQGSQPPLYYALMALATAWIDTSDLPLVRHINPHAEVGVVTADGNINLVAHAPNEMSQWRGTALAVKLIRFLSVLLGMGTVLFTFLFCRELLPNQPLLALAAAGLVAFTPMFLFISASVNNDNLVILLASATLWRLVVWVRQPPSPLSRDAVLLGVLLGLGALTKVSALGLWALAAGVIVWTNRQHLRNMALSGGLVFGIAALICGWWYVRNLQLYGDWLGWNAFIAIAGPRPQVASLVQLWDERESFIRAYWGIFGGLGVPLPSWVYTVLNGSVLVAVIGLGLALFRARQRFTLQHLILWALPLLWLIALGVGVVRWSSLTLASQGRLIFPGLAALGVLIALGLAQYTRWLPWVLVCFMAVVAVITPFAVIAPAYQPISAVAPPANVNADFGGEMRLLGYTLPTVSARPGDTVRLTLQWQTEIAMDRNWSVFVHLVDEAGVIVAQKDRYPGNGLWATTFLSPEQTWTEDYVLALPTTLYAPTEAHVVVGLYDHITGERLPLSSGASDVATLASLHIDALPSAEGLPNAMDINLGQQMALRGYTIAPRVLAAGEPLTVTLFWRGLVKMDANYAVSVRVRGDGETMWAARDAWPLNGNAPTPSWTPGETLEDVYALTLNPDTPPGQYVVEVVVYNTETSKRLQQISPDGRLTDNDFIQLSKIRVTP